VSFNEAYFAASALAWIRGIEDFEARMPKDRARRLHNDYLFAFGFRPGRPDFSKYLVDTALYKK
jgi:hypothetical protein